MTRETYKEADELMTEITRTEQLIDFIHNVKFDESYYMVKHLTEILGEHKVLRELDIYLTKLYDKFERL